MIYEISRLTKPVELRYTPQGTPVANMRIAINRGTKDKPRTTFINCVLWKQTAEFAHNNLGKGSKIFIEGHLDQRSYEKDGKTITYHEITVMRLQSLSPSKNNNQAPQQEPAQEALEPVS